MQKVTLIIFIILSSLILLVFIGGIILFIIQYRKRKLEHEHEKSILQEEHQMQLLQTQISSQTQTMHHIGREIHDSVGQKLTLASIYTKQLQVNDEKVNTISHIIDESLQELRQLSKSLTDPAQVQAGITELLQTEASRINASGACFVHVNHNEEIVLSQSNKHILLRLLQEFMQNSLKHAACRNIYIELSQNGDALNVTAKDDGKGFDIQETSNGLGLYSMKRRADELNAAYELQSTAGAGTKLSLSFNRTT
jgi:signal transduction histidine kinase